MWQRGEYETAAQKIGKEFIDSHGNGTISINQLSTKIARDNNLTPEGIRTMVRLANVAVFEEIFHKKADGDKMIEFEVGDPEVVINTLYQETKTAMSAQDASSDDYDFGADYYGDMETPVQSEKVAECPADEPPVYISPLEVRERFTRAKEKLAMEKRVHECEWVEALEKVAKLLVVSAPAIEDYTSFEKDALSALGEHVVPELQVLHELTGKCGKYALLGGEKVASVLDTHVSNPPPETRSIIPILKEAQEARNQFTVCKRGLEWLSENMVRIK